MRMSLLPARNCGVQDYLLKPVLTVASVLLRASRRVCSRYPQQQLVQLPCICAELPNATYRLLNVVAHSISVPYQTLASAGEYVQRAWQSSAHRPSLVHRNSSRLTCVCHAPWCIHAPSAANSPRLASPACWQVPRHLQKWTNEAASRPTASVLFHTVTCRQRLSMLQAFNSSSGLVMRGSASILSGLQVYQAKEWVLRSWRDVFVDLVQGQLQFLFLSLLTGGLPYAQCAMLDLVLLTSALTHDTPFVYGGMFSCT